MKKERVIVYCGKFKTIFIEVKINTEYKWEVLVYEESSVLGIVVLKSWVLENKKKSMQRFYSVLDQENGYFEALLDAHGDTKRKIA